jgi:hypothetical protein
MLTNTCTIRSCAFPGLGHIGPLLGVAGCHISKLFFDGKRQRIPPDCFCDSSRCRGYRTRNAVTKKTSKVKKNVRFSLNWRFARRIYYISFSSSPQIKVLSWTNLPLNTCVQTSMYYNMMIILQKRHKYRLEKRRKYWSGRSFLSTYSSYSDVWH